MYSVLRRAGSRMSGWVEIGFALVAMALLTFSLGPPAHAQLYATYYVRPDGGSAGQCTGLVDAAYPGNGTAQPCAWDHPFRALPPDGTPRIAAGDTLIIASGSYMMGYGAPGADNCSSNYPWDCYMPALPSGPDPAHPTQLLGTGWDAGCSTPPELWGTEREYYVLNLTDASNVEVACLEITDHSGCVEHHSGGLACNRDTFPHGPWAAIGLYAEDSANVHLRDLDIHGLAHSGVLAGRLTDWTVEDVRIAGNGWVGWDGDLEGSDSNSGTLCFRDWTVEWNGCGETYPGEQPTGCWAQTAGGYGDGVGTGATGGNWIIEDSSFLHNTSDGLDLLYHSLGGRIVLDRVHAEGNAGNQVKITGQAAITNSILVGNCAFFEGKSFTYNVDPCRALGNTLELAYAGGEQVSIVNTTVYGQGDGLVSGGALGDGYACNGTETVTGRNNVFLGDDDFNSAGDISFLFYPEDCAGLELDSDYSIVHRAKNIACGTNGTYVNSGAHDLCQDPQLSGPFSGNTYGMLPNSGSPAIDAGDNTVCPSTDYRGLGRPVDGNGNGNAVCDMGAYEHQSLVFLPVIQHLVPTIPPTPQIVQPGDLQYLGAFRLPGGDVRPQTFAYGGNAMTFNPNGDPSGSDDGFPGSLFVTGHDRLAYGELPDGSQVAEINIPQPLISDNLAELNQGSFLQQFHNVAQGFFTELEEIPRIGMQYLNAPATGAKIHLAWGQHMPPDRSVASHAWFNPNLSSPDMQGTWFIGNQSLDSVNGYVFQIPSSWANEHAQGRNVGTGRFRDGGWSGMGPALFAYRPWIDDSGTPPSSGTYLEETVLLLYQSSLNTSNIERCLDHYQHPDEWEGGAWITTNTGKSAVLFAGTKGTGAKYWYGYVNPAGPDYPCVHQASVGEFAVCRLADGTLCPSQDLTECEGHNDYRGWWSARFDAQFILYDPADLARVAAGEAESWEPQPYASLDIDEHLFLNPAGIEQDNLGTGVQRISRIGAVAYSRSNDLLYVLELFADEARPVVHVWRVQ